MDKVSMKGAIFVNNNKENDKHPEDGNHHQQFDQCKAATT